MGYLSALDSMPRLGGLDAQSQAASQTVTMATYVDVRDAHRVYAIVNCGDLDSGGVTVNFLQATDASGTGSKALTAGGWAQVVSTTDSAKLEFEADVEDLDGDNDFGFVAIQIVTSGAVSSAAFFSADLWSIAPTYQT